MARPDSTISKFAEKRRAGDIRRTRPRVQVLSNGKLVSIISESGAGRLMFEEIALTRWEPDGGRESGGYAVFVRDRESGDCWQIGLPGVDDDTEGFRCINEAGLARFEHAQRGIRSTMDVFVSVDDDAEVRFLTLRNDSRDRRRLDITSYVELALNTPAADSAHPAFSKLFIQTNYDPESEVLTAWRRRRSPDEETVMVSHLMRGDGRAVGFGTSRASFIGRGRSLRAPAGLELDATLGGEIGSVLDPAFVLRREIELEPGEEGQFLLVLAAARTEPHLNSITARFLAPGFDVGAEGRAAEAREIERLLMNDFDADDASVLRRMTSALYYDDPKLQAPEELVARLGAPITRLEQYGIRAHAPLVVMRVADEDDTRLVSRLLRMHRYWTSLRLDVQLLLLNDQTPISASEKLQASIEQTLAQYTGAVSSGAPVTMIYSDDIPPEDQILLQSMAAILVRDALPSFADDSGEAPGTRAKLFGRPAAVSRPGREHQSYAAKEDLAFDNGYGGFDKTGSEYVVRLPYGPGGRHVLPPHPWTNVIANERLGCIVSETGAGCTWSVNSRENRLTAWSNDPVSDPHAEAFYIRDEDRGEYWSPMPGPARAPTDYEVRHGIGYTRFQSKWDDLDVICTQFVDPHGPVKITRVRLTNLSDKPRTISLFSYYRLILGGDQHVSSRLVQCDWDEHAKCLVAKNGANNEFADRLTFAAVRCPGSETFYTARRSEFLGLTTGPERPYAIEHEPELSGSTAVGDAAACLQSRVILPAGGDVECDFLLGDTADEQELHSVLRSYRDADDQVGALNRAIDYWHEITGRLAIRTPAPEVDLLVNHWLPYQNLSCRLFGRSAFYQSGGAYGYRDQLQDASAMALVMPELTRQQILLHAGHQFVEGDVLHWWHPPANKGIRTRFADDLLWLPFVTSYYLDVTGDDHILDEEAPYLTGPV
ncbi:MAG: GH36-type glycosyl hydrolase domain-containing protein, partial [Rhodothermales bacterium]